MCRFKKQQSEAFICQAEMQQARLVVWPVAAHVLDNVNIYFLQWRSNMDLFQRLGFYPGILIVVRRFRNFFVRLKLNAMGMFELDLKIKSE